jgi:hypothetical protein
MEKSVIELNFTGPYKFSQPGNNIFTSPYAESAGVYLWTIRQKCDGSYLIHYVGETASFAKRQRQHLIGILGLDAGIFDPDRAQNGVCNLVWPGMWRDQSPKAPLRQIKAYEFINKTVLEYVDIIDVFFAKTDIDVQTRRHAEGCIAWNLRNNHPEDRVLYPDDNHAGMSRSMKNGSVMIRANEHIRGLDAVIEY